MRALICPLLLLLLLPLLAGQEEPAAALAWGDARLGSDDPTRREAARRLLAGLGDRARPALLQALASPDWRCREGALAAFAMSRSVPPGEALLPLAQDSSWAVRAALLRAWGRHGLGLELPRRCLEDPFHDVRRAALLALAAQGGLASEEIARALADRNGSVRAAAEQILLAAAALPPLEELPGRPGERLRVRALRAMAVRPDPGQLPALRKLLAAGEATLGEKLLALQVVIPLGSRQRGDAELILAGLTSSRVEIRGAAMAAGRLLTTGEVARILRVGLLLPGVEGFNSFLAILAGRERALAGHLAALLDLVPTWYGQRRQDLARVFDLLPGGWLAVQDWDREYARRLGEFLGLARRAGAEGLADRLLARARDEEDDRFRRVYEGALLFHAANPRVRARLLADLVALPAWERAGAVKEILRHLAGREEPELLVPLEKGELSSPRARRYYLQALAGYPGSPRFKSLLRHLALTDGDSRVGESALRLLVRRPGTREEETLALLDRIARRRQLSRSLRRLCLEELVTAGALPSVKEILAGLEKKERLAQQVDLARFLRRREQEAGAELLREWAHQGRNTRLEALAHLGLAGLGRQESFAALVRLAPTMGESLAARVARVFHKAPAASALALFRCWCRPDSPQYLRIEACHLAGGRPDLELRKELEAMAGPKEEPALRGGALRALVARGQDGLPRRVLPRLLALPRESPEDETLQELLAGIKESRAPWAAPYFWRAILENRFRDPLGEVARTRRRTGWTQRADQERVRLLSDQLFALEDEVVARALDMFLAPWRGTRGGILLGKDVLEVLLEGTLATGNRAARPLTAVALARFSLDLHPPGRFDDLTARIILADHLEGQGRWAQAAGELEEAARWLLLGRTRLRRVEFLLGENQPARGLFPLVRLAARPLLLRARAAQAAGDRQEASRLVRLALERGRADRLLVGEAHRLNSTLR